MERDQLIRDIRTGLGQFPVTCLVGPRQCGKTTAARAFVERYGDTFRKVIFLDLEDPTDQERLSDPKLFLSELEGLVVIDEVQRLPELFPIFRVLIDRPNNPLRFLILGSASTQLIQRSSESLAGKILYREVTPFHINELPLLEPLEQLWSRSGFPRSYLAHDENERLR